MAKPRLLQRRGKRSAIILIVAAVVIYLLILLVIHLSAQNWQHNKYIADRATSSESYISALEKGENTRDFDWPQERPALPVGGGPPIIFENDIMTLDTALSDFKRDLTGKTYYRAATIDRQESIAIVISDKGFQKLMEEIGQKPSESMPDAVFISDYAASTLDYRSDPAATDYLLVRE